MRKTKTATKLLKKEAQKLYAKGLTYQEIATMLGLKSHQLARYYITEKRYGNKDKTELSTFNLQTKNKQV